jgi:hypothetical protein
MPNRLFAHQVSTRLDFEGDGGIPYRHLGGKLLYPVMVQREDVITEPDMLDAGVLQQPHLLGNGVGWTQVKLIP